VARLREAASLPMAGAAEPASGGGDAPSTPAPDWVDDARVATRLDADALLAAGEVPLTRLHQALCEAGGRLVCLTTTFRPAPLIEALERAGHQTWTQQLAPGSFRVYVRPR